MIVAMGLPAPELSQNPLGFLETYLKRHLDPDDGDGGGPPRCYAAR